MGSRVASLIEALLSEPPSCVGHEQARTVSVAK